MSHYVDANLMHDVVSGKSVTGILHLVNKVCFCDFGLFHHLYVSEFRSVDKKYWFSGNNSF